MQRLYILIPLLLVLAAACDSEQKGCPEGLSECNDGECHECCIDDNCFEKPGMADCPKEYIICNDDYECECVCYREGEDCSRNPGFCCGGLVCDIFTNTCWDFSCETDADCPDSYTCQFGECVEPGHCNQDADCRPGGKCFNGDCVTVPDCSDIRECIVLPTSGVTKTGTTTAFSAIPYLLSGAVAPGHGFNWSSSETNVAEVEGGLVTGGPETGTATITAVVESCEDITCDAVLTNYGTLPTGVTRVLVVEEFTGQPIQGATVVLGTEPPATTDTIGTATFNVEFNKTNPGDITVSKRDYHYVTLKSVKTNDVIVHLSPLHNLDFSQDPPVRQAGGIKGKFDFGMIRCREPFKTCDIAFGLAGLSIPPSLTRLGRGMLSTGAIMTLIELGGTSESWPMEPGYVLCVQQTCFKEFFTPTGAPGNRVAWGIGGRMDLGSPVDEIGPIIINGEGIEIYMANLGRLGLAANFYSAMVPNVDIVPRPVVSDVNDIDGDPATLEVPDYDNFPPQDMTLKIGTDQTMTFNAPALPLGVYDGVLVRGGIVVRGVGFVPLGVGLGVDSRGELDPPDGVIDDPIVLNVADVAGRIPEGQFQRVIIALAVKLQDYGEPERWAGQVLFVDSFSGTHTLPPFLPPVVAGFDRVGRRLEILQMPIGVDLLQAVFAGENEASWHVLTEELGSFDLPPAPPEGDRADSVGVYAVDLTSEGFQELVEFNDLNMGNVVENLLAFSYSEVP